MAETTGNLENAVRDLLPQVRSTQSQVRTLMQGTHNEELEHAELALAIAGHAFEEVLEHTGLSGAISRNPDAAAHARVEGWLSMVKGVHQEAEAFLAGHQSEDLETALRALTIAEGSLHEVAEHYE